jgi:His-Xaa-Ser system radical SAM maturase HxsC
MIPLQTLGQCQNIHEEFIGVVDSKEDGESLCIIGWSLYGDADMETIAVSTKSIPQIGPNTSKCVEYAHSLDHLSDGDVVIVKPGGMLRTIFRKNSQHNTLFITDRCNSNCLMCSQPPRNINDLDYHYEVNSKLINLIPNTTNELGITGGEPTLLGKRLIFLFNQLKECLPVTRIHVLTNGRSFAWKQLPYAVSEIKNQNVMFGIPLYSDYYLHHDYIVQAKNAHSQTMMGLYNMARFELRIEIRIVLHKLTYKRLPQLARYIYKNLPFVEHVAFMGLEFVGYTPYNKELLWIEPSLYQAELEDAALYLESVGMEVSIYNLPLCLARKSIWSFCRRSISDWKREYISECSRCILATECGGLFGTSKMLSSEIRAITL